MSLQKHILVTGANTGIGLALTKQLVKDHGCHVYLGSRSEERGQKAVDEVKGEAGESVELLAIVSVERTIKREVLYLRTIISHSLPILLLMFFFYFS